MATMKHCLVYATQNTPLYSHIPRMRLLRANIRLSNHKPGSSGWDRKQGKWPSLVPQVAIRR